MKRQSHCYTIVSRRLQEESNSPKHSGCIKPGGVPNVGPSSVTRIQHGMGEMQEASPSQRVWHEDPHPTLIAIRQSSGQRSLKSEDSTAVRSSNTRELPTLPLGAPWLTDTEAYSMALTDGLIEKTSTSSPAPLYITRLTADYICFTISSTLNFSDLRRL